MLAGLLVNVRAQNTRNGATTETQILYCTQFMPERKRNFAGSENTTLVGKTEVEKKICGACRERIPQENGMRTLEDYFQDQVSLFYFRQTFVLKMNHSLCWRLEILFISPAEVAFWDNFFD